MADINQITIDLSKTYTDSMQQDAIHEIDTIAKDVKSNGMSVYENCVIVTDNCGYPFLQTSDGNFINLRNNYDGETKIHGENSYHNCTDVISENEYTSSENEYASSDTSFYKGRWTVDELANLYVVTSIRTQYGKVYSVDIQPLSSDSMKNSYDGIVYKVELIPASDNISKTPISTDGWFYSESITDQSGNTTYKVKFKLIPVFKFTLEGPKDNK